MADKDANKMKSMNLVDFLFSVPPAKFKCVETGEEFIIGLDDINETFEKGEIKNG